MNRPSAEGIRGIYRDIEKRGDLAVNMEGWNSTTPIFGELIFQSQPKVIVEAGVWNGASLIHMASVCKERGLSPILFGCDVFYGNSTDHIGHLPDQMMPPFWRTPSRYDQFLFNVKAHGHDDCIIPVCNFTAWAARILAKWEVVADLVWVDAGHTEEFCTADFEAYWPLLRSGGVMGFDDLGYPGVVSAVGRFGMKHNLSLQIVGGQGYFRKP